MNNIFLLVIIILFLAAALKVAELFKAKPIDQADASKFVLEDLRSKYPGADIGFVNISEKVNDQGSKYFEIKARVTQDAATPCPERLHIFYNYPNQNFVPQPAEVITRNCRVCTEGLCAITFKEEAVIASHTMPGTSMVDAFLADKPNIPSSVEEGNDSWVVRWTDGSAGFDVRMAKNGVILNVTQLSFN